MLSKPEKILPDKLDKIKEKLRNEALVREYKRLRFILMKKGRIIFYQKITLVVSLLLLVILGGFTFFPVNLKTEYQVHSLETKPTQVIEKTAVPITPSKLKNSFYHVRFDGAPEFILATFPRLNTAINFCTELKNMKLPSTSVLKDSTRIRSTSKIEIGHHAEYSIQLGAFQHFYLKKYTQYFHSLKHQYSNGLHKYQLGPFMNFSTGKQIALQLDLQQFYLVETTYTKPSTPILLEKILQLESPENYLSHQNHLK